MAFETGLTSVTFRQLGAPEILSLAKQSGLDGIEWGGDVHVPHGDAETARSIAQMTADTGLKIFSYGSYYRFDESVLPFGDVLKTARELKCRDIRVWAGDKGSGEADSDYRNSIVRQTREIAREAQGIGCNVSFEYHGGSLTDTAESAVDLIESVGCENVKLYWQPVPELGVQGNCRALQAVLPYLSNAHVFHWLPGTLERKQLQEGRRDWEQYIEILKEDGTDRALLLEFVLEDSAENFLLDARTLIDLVGN